MTTFDPLHAIQSGIVEALAAAPGLTVSSLHKSLNKEKKTRVSLPNLYRTVGQMVDAQILVREKGTLALSHAWIPHVLHLADAIRANYGQGSVVKPLKEGERREYSAESLGSLDGPWFHVLAHCADADPAREWYAYNSHPWHPIGMSDTELRGYHALALKGIGVRMLYGNDTFLDRYGKKLVRTKGFRITIDPNAPFPKEGYALWVCGDHVIECVFPETIAKRFAYFFETVKNVGQFDPELFADVFRMKARCKVTIRRNKKEAARLRALLKKRV